MLNELKEKFPPLTNAIPTDHHPMTLYNKDIRDDLPTRATVQALSALYGSWSAIAETEVQVKDKSKLLDYVHREMTKSVTKIEGTIQHVRELEKANDDAINKALIGKRTAHASEIRNIYRERKAKLSELVADAQSNIEIAGALYRMAPVLTGLTPAEQELLNDAIERAHVSDSYATRASARKGLAKLEAAKERFGTGYVKKMGQWANSDDVLIAKKVSAA